MDKKKIIVSVLLTLALIAIPITAFILNSNTNDKVKEPNVVEGGNVDPNAITHVIINPDSLKFTNQVNTRVETVQAGPTPDSYIERKYADFTMQYEYYLQASESTDGTTNFYKIEGSEALEEVLVTMVEVDGEWVFYSFVDEEPEGWN